MRRFLLLASHRRFLLILLVLAILVSLVDAYIKGPAVTWDEAAQLATVQSLLDGEDFTLEYVRDAQDISVTSSELLLTWPPGLALLVAIPHLVLQDIWWSMLLIEFLFRILFFVGLWRLMNQLSHSLSSMAILALLLFWVFSSGPIVNSTNQISLTLFLWAIVLVLHTVNMKSHYTRMAVFSGVLLGLAFVVRYAYLPLLAVIPLATVMMARYSREMKWLVFGIIHGVTSSIFVASVFGYNYWRTGLFTRSDVAVTSGVLQWNHLGYFAPIGADAIDASNGLNYGLSLFGVSQPLIASAVGLVSLLLLMVFAIIMWHYVSSLFKFNLKSQHSTTDVKKLSIESTFFLVAAITSMVLILYIGYLGLTNELKIIGESPWIFVNEERYFSPMWFMIQLALVMFLFPMSDANWHPWRKIRYAIGIFLIPVLVLTAGTNWVNLRFEASKLPSVTGEARLANDNPFFASTKQVMQETNEPIVAILGTTYGGMQHMHTLLMAGAAVYNGDIALLEDLATTSPRTVLLAIPSVELGATPEIGLLHSIRDRFDATVVLEDSQFFSFYYFTLESSSG